MHHFRLPEHTMELRRGEIGATAGIDIGPLEPWRRSLLRDSVGHRVEGAR
jgi:hypothetical protein